MHYMNRRGTEPYARIGVRGRGLQPPLLLDFYDPIHPDAVRIVPFRYAFLYAMASISTLAALGRLATSKADRAGGLSVKNVA